MFFTYMAASANHIISAEVENHIFKPIEFLDTSAFINNPHWQSSGILIFLCKYCIVISHTLVDSYQNFMRNQEGKIELQKKVHRRICVKDITFLTARSSFYVFLLFVAFFIYSLPLRKWRPCGMTPINVHILLWVVYCVMIS